MKSPGFWWKDNSVTAALLKPAEALYRKVADERLAREGAHARIPVVCIGNLTVGGAGKTPTAIATGRILAEAGERPVFLSRGYGARMAGPVRVDLGFHRAIDVGDEPILLAREYPTIVARDRVAGADSGGRTDATVIVMDDGFQNASIAKECAVLVVDAASGVGNNHVFPAGPLRAGLAPQLDRAQAVVVVGKGDAATAVVEQARERRIALFHARIEPDAAVLAELRGKPVLAFAGIAAPEKFFATLTENGIDVRKTRAFGDHHTFREPEVAALLNEAESEGLTPVTTEKDYVRLAGRGPYAALRARTRTLPVSLAIDDEERYRAFLIAQIRGSA